MRRVAERPLASVDERGPHAVRLRSDTIEGVIGDEQNVGPLLAEDLGGFGVSLPVRLEIAGLLDRDDVIERKADMRPGRLEHVAVTIRENGELVSLGSKLFECRSHIGEWLELLDLAHEPPRFVRRVPDAAAIHHVRHRALSDLPIGRVPAIAQRVDHRVLEVGAAPPGDEAVRPAAPALALEKGVTASVSPFCISTMVPY